jgi:hypothetical protein
MKTKRMLLVTGGLSAIALIGGLSWIAPALARGVDMPPMFVKSPAGDLHIFQSLPGTCDNVNQSTPITRGLLEIAPSEGIDVPGGKSFVLTRASLSFAPFTVDRECMTQDVTREFTDIGVQLVRTASFTGVPSGPGVFDFAIPKDNLLFYQSSTVNGELQTSSMRPKEDVTGTIDLANGAFAMQVAIATTIHFKFGCFNPCSIGGGSCEECLVNDDYHGTLTTTISGPIAFPDADGDTVPDRSDNCKFSPNADQTPVATPVVTPPPDVTLASCLDTEIGTASGKDICDATPVTVTSNAPAVFVPGNNVVTWTGQDGKGRLGSSNQTVTVVDTTPPLVSCVPAGLPAHVFRVSSSDDCTSSMRLGDIALVEGERIKIEEVGRGGVRQVNVLSPGGIRHFNVGKGEGVIVATDGAGNVASATCPRK